MYNRELEASFIKTKRGPVPAKAFHDAAQKEAARNRRKPQEPGAHLEQQVSANINRAK
jgi:hypothetical protein